MPIPTVAGTIASSRLDAGVSMSIYAISSDGTRLTQLTSGGHDESDPARSSYGKRLSFTWLSPQGKTRRW